MTEEAAGPSLIERLASEDDIAAINELILEIGKEAAALETRRIWEQEQTRDHSQTSSRRVSALAKMGDLLLAKRKSVLTEGLDTNSPGVKILVQYVLEQVKGTIEELGLPQEVLEQIMTRLPEKMTDWQSQVDKRVKQAIFRMDSSSG